MAITERYGLSRSSRKYKCPCCGKMSFTYYVDRGYNPLDQRDQSLDLIQVNGEYILGADYGWCDRENKCAYHRTPKEFFADRKINGSEYQKAFQPIEEAPKVIIPIDNKYVAATMFYPDGKYRCDSTLMKYITRLPLSVEELQNLINAIVLYRIGVCKQLVDEWDSHLQQCVTSEGQGTIFWMIDADNRVRAGKMMYYRSDGHRDHNCRPRSVKYKLIEKGVLPKDYEVAQCLFGEHLLNEPQFESKKVFVVESEKTAFLCAMLKPEYLWMACSSKGCANELHLQPLKDRGRTIILMPDLDGYWTDELEKQLHSTTDELHKRILNQRKQNAWNIKVEHLKKWYNKIYVSDYVLTNAKPEDGPSCDIGDIIIRKILERDEDLTTNEAFTPVNEEQNEPSYDGVQMTEPLKLLIEKLDLIPIENG